MVAVVLRVVRSVVPSAPGVVAVGPNIGLGVLLLGCFVLSSFFVEGARCRDVVVVVVVVAESVKNVELSAPCSAPADGDGRPFCVVVDVEKLLLLLFVMLLC